MKSMLYTKVRTDIHVHIFIHIPPPGENEAKCWTVFFESVYLRFLSLSFQFCVYDFQTPANLTAIILVKTVIFFFLVSYLLYRYTLRTNK